ncbi:MAG TPA: phosphatidate cytidylyltransferase, partial [Actinomycetota bacterium]
MPSGAEALFVPAAERLTLALGGALGAIVLVERHHLRELTRRVLFVRWRTWLVTAPIYGAAVMWSRWGALAFAMLLAGVASWEYARLAGLPRAYRTALIGVGAASLLGASLAAEAWTAVQPVALLALTLIPLIRQDVRDGFRNLAYTVAGYLYLPMLLGFFLLLRERVAGGPGLLLAIGTAVAASDVAAFIAGKAFGHRALADRVSPAKTLEGVAGNLIGAYAGFALMSFAVPETVGPVARAILPAAIAIGCVWGDLLESLIKRCADRKDAAGWLPGFGG